MVIISIIAFNKISLEPVDESFISREGGVSITMNRNAQATQEVSPAPPVQTFEEGILERVEQDSLAKSTAAATPGPGSSNLNKLGPLTMQEAIIILAEMFTGGHTCHKMQEYRPEHVCEMLYLGMKDVEFVVEVTQQYGVDNVTYAISSADITCSDDEPYNIGKPQTLNDLLDRMTLHEISKISA
jgi:hypothetical protein